MTNVTKQRNQDSVDTAAVAPATSEDLLASVLDDDTATALAERGRTQGVALLGKGWWRTDRRAGLGWRAGDAEAQPERDYCDCGAGPTALADNNKGSG